MTNQQAAFAVHQRRLRTLDNAVAHYPGTWIVTEGEVSRSCRGHWRASWGRSYMNKSGPRHGSVVVSGGMHWPSGSQYQSRYQQGSRWQSSDVQLCATSVCRKNILLGDMLLTADQNRRETRCHHCCGTGDWGQFQDVPKSRSVHC